MPEFMLDTTAPVDGRRWEDLDPFTQGYIEALFFTDASDPDDGELQDKVFADLAPAALDKILEETKRFQDDNWAHLEAACDRQGYDRAAAGRDFWYTRNGHGVGYWDRDVLDADGLGEQLTATAHFFPACDVYLGDDGSVWVT